MPDKIRYSWESVQRFIMQVQTNLPKLEDACIYGIPRGGLPGAVFLSNCLQIPLVLDISKCSLYKNVILMDEIFDSGKTMLNHLEFLRSTSAVFPIVFVVREASRSLAIENNVLYDWVVKGDQWVVFSWELFENETKRNGTADSN